MVPKSKENRTIYVCLEEQMMMMFVGWDDAAPPGITNNEMIVLMERVAEAAEEIEFLSEKRALPAVQATIVAWAPSSPDHIIFDCNHHRVTGKIPPKWRKTHYNPYF